MAAPILNPAKLPDPNDPNFIDYSNKEIRLNSYGTDIEVYFKGEMFISPPVIDAEQAISEWPVFAGFCKKKRSP